MLQDLPVELIIGIFQFVVQASDEGKHPRLTLSHVSSQLRRIIVDSPLYWTHIELDIGDPTTLAQAQTYLSRTKSQPIDLFVLLNSGMLPRLNNVSDAVEFAKACSNQVQDLALRFVLEAEDAATNILSALDTSQVQSLALDYDTQAELPDPGDLLPSHPICLPPLPQLAALDTTNIVTIIRAGEILGLLKALTSTEDLALGPPYANIQPVISIAPELEELSLIRKYWIGFLNEGEYLHGVPPPSCPNLRRLTLYCIIDLFGYTATNFDAPVLEEISWTDSSHLYEDEDEVDAEIMFPPGPYKPRPSVRTLTIKFSFLQHKRSFIHQSFPNLEAITMPAGAVRGLWGFEEGEDNVGGRWPSWAHMKDINIVGMSCGEDFEHILSTLLKLVENIKIHGLPIRLALERGYANEETAESVVLLDKLATEVEVFEVNGEVFKPAAPTGG